MAEGEERNGNLVADEQGAGNYPIGFKFIPTDEELVEFYLLPRLQGRPTVPNDAIIEANVYEFHPATLVYEKYRDRGKDAWYFLSPRTRMYKNGARPARKTDDGCGRWKSSSAATKGLANETVSDGISFCKNVLNYFVGTPKNEERTEWLMRELTIPAYEIKPGSNSATLDEYVMCKIYLSPVHNANNGEASTSLACEEEEEEEEAQHSQLTPVSELYGRKDGKRPLEERSRSCATARKQARQGGILTIGETQASSAGNVSVPAQPTRYNGHAPVQRPPIPTQFPHTGYPNSYGQAMPTMVRPTNLGFAAPAGTSFRPQVSLYCSYDHNYRSVQPQSNLAYGMPPQQRPMAFALPQQSQMVSAPPPPSQQFYPFFDDNANVDHAGAIASRWPPYNSNPYEGTLMALQVAGDQAEATSPYAGSGMKGGNVNAEHHFLELASINTLLAESRAQTPVVDPRIELATPVSSPQVETWI